MFELGAQANGDRDSPSPTGVDPKGWEFGKIYTNKHDNSDILTIRNATAAPVDQTPACLLGSCN